MKINRWFKALVLGGATLGAVGCGAKGSSAAGGSGSSATDTTVAVDSKQAQEQDTTVGQDAAKAAMDILAAMDAVKAADTAATATDSATSATDSATSAADTVTSAADAASTAADAATSAADTAALKCSAMPSPGDPCGCPCCWATGFLNTSPQCKSFCSAGNGGAGCCA